MSAVLLKKKLKANNVHIQLQIDNVTAVAYLNNMGGSRQSSYLNALTLEMWELAMKKPICLHILGKHNIDADKESRNFLMET